MDPARMLTESLNSGPELENSQGQTRKSPTLRERLLVALKLPVPVLPRSARNRPERLIRGSQGETVQKSVLKAVGEAHPR
jgi:hypothetical protein